MDRPYLVFRCPCILPLHFLAGPASFGLTQCSLRSLPIFVHDTFYE